MIDKAMLKASGGQLYTQKLFLELNGWDSSAAVYTLTDNDKVLDNGRTVYSLGRLYVEMEDIHEYNFAKKYFDSWRHWQRICDSPLLKAWVEEWRVELAMKIRSRNFKRMEEHAAEGDHRAVKYLADKSWELGKSIKERGRPSKEEKQGYLKQAAEEATRLDDDYKRIRELQ